jgi:Homeodomain-like domain
MSRGERRIGVRADQKRRWDLEHPARCTCGAECTRGYDRCLACYRAAERARRDQRRAVIAKRWTQGATTLEIAEELHTTAATVHTEIQHMRREGIDLPLRRPRQPSARDV